MKRTFFIAFLLISGSLLFSKNKTNKFIQLMINNRLGFHATMCFNRLKNHSDFTFHNILDNQSLSGQFCVTYDTAGNITTLSDGKRTPLLLGSIPYKSHHVKNLKRSCTLIDKAMIGVFTLNEPWELKTSGSCNLDSTLHSMKRFYYPTKDYQAPSFIDILRAVHDLEHRDEWGLDLAFVHCKAGRGRSATIVAAYLMTVLYEHDQAVDLELIIQYLKSCRSCVSLKQSQQKILQHFYKELKKAGSLELLYQKYLKEIKKREIEVAKIFNV